jgi:hypothetical protein
VQPSTPLGPDQVNVIIIIERSAVLWRELDAAIGRRARVEFGWAKAHSGILLNECADQLETRGVKGTSNFPGEIVETPAEEIESEKEFAMNDEDVTMEADWDEFEHIAPGTASVRSLGSAEEEETIRGGSAQAFRTRFLGGIKRQSESLNVRR